MVAEVELSKGSVDHSSASKIVAHFGSRLRLRLWGIFQSDLASRLPMRAEITLDDNGSSTGITVAMSSDEGWYLGRLPQLAEEYRLAFAARATAWKSATVA